jgi:hypothetical protein
VNPVQFALIAVVRIYQLALAPLWSLLSFLPPVCRYTPTCSQYFIEAVRKKGALKGAWMGIRRILRCHPAGGGGYDPVE